jgi:protease-4
LSAAGGDTARLALNYGLVDELLNYDEMSARVIDVVGSDLLDADNYAAINHVDYLKALRATQFPITADDQIKIIVAAGEIIDGSQPSGTIGSDSLGELIRKARQDDTTRALVLRVDSPGGSAFASEVIRRELELYKQTERPLVVSMGSVAASGGYWIAMNADEIWASPTTLTGSIGVGAVFPTFQRTLAELGINIDGVGTTTLSGQMNALQGIGDEIRAYVEQSIQHTYDDFVGRVASHREMQPDDVERSAQGRVWIGSEAQTRGLVDELGDLRSTLRARYGDKVRTRLITAQRGLFGRRVPGVSAGLAADALAGIGEAGLNALDERMLWARYGL